MKNHLLSLCMTLFLIFAGGMTAGCDKLDDKYKSEKTITLTIASVKPAAADDDYDWLQGLPVYIYKEESPDWRCGIRMIRSGASMKSMRRGMNT